MERTKRMLLLLVALLFICGKTLARIDLLNRTTLQCGQTYTSGDLDIIKSGCLTISENGDTLLFDQLTIDCDSEARYLLYASGIDTLSIVLKGDNLFKTRKSAIGCIDLNRLIITGEGTLTLNDDYAGNSHYASICINGAYDYDYQDWGIGGELVIDNTTVTCSEKTYAASCRSLLVRNSRFEGHDLYIDNLTMEGCSIRAPYNGWFDPDKHTIVDEGFYAEHFIISTPEDDNIIVQSRIFFLDQRLICKKTYTSADFPEIKSGSFSVSENGMELTFNDLLIDHHDNNSDKGLFHWHLFLQDDRPISLILKGENNIKTSVSCTMNLGYFSTMTITGEGSLTTKSSKFDFKMDIGDIIVDNTTLNCLSSIAMGDDITTRKHKVIVNHSMFKGGNFYNISSLTLINSEFVSPKDVVFNQKDTYALRDINGNIIRYFEIEPMEGDFNNRVSPWRFDDITVAKGKSKDLTFNMKNDGIEEVKDIAYVWSVGGVETEERSETLEPPYAQTGDDFTVSLSIPTGNSIGSEEALLTVTKVNGHENTSVWKTAKGVLNTVSEEPTRRVVVEEFTGTWCGFCTRGTLGLELLNEEYGDDIITIAVHDNDPMVADTYTIGVSSFPTAKVDRGEDTDAYYGNLNSFDLFEPFGIKDLVEEERNIGTPAGIEVSAKWGKEDKSAIRVDTKTTFFIKDDASNYTIGFALLEDGMKGSGSGWAQANNYSGCSYEDDPNLQRLSVLPDPITDMEYNHVAVDALGIRGGIRGSIKHIEINVPQEYIYLWNISTNKLIQDKSKLTVVALLFNKKTERICNAAKTTIADYSSGIEELKMTDAGRSAVYSISGRKVASSVKSLDKLPKGIYIINGQKFVNK
jgi:thiol-disulfide isomerase/thioredoxin